MTDDTILFDRRIAEKFGITEAILINKIWGWIKHNAKNGTNFYDGRYWTYNSAASYAEDLTFVSERTISSVLKKLSDKGILLISNYNKTKFDRTSWYSFSDEGFVLMSELGYELNAIAPKNIEKEDVANPSAKSADGSANIANGNADSAEQYQSINTIPYPNINQSFSFLEKNEKTDVAAEDSTPYDPFEDVWEEWCEYAKEQHNAKSRMLKSQRETLIEYTQGNARLAKEITRRAMNGGHSMFIPLKDENNIIEKDPDEKWE